MSQDALTDRMRRLAISETDLAENFARSSGPGGQHVIHKQDPWPGNSLRPADAECAGLDVLLPGGRTEALL